MNSGRATTLRPCVLGPYLHPRLHMLWKEKYIYRVSLCSPSCPGAHYIDQADLKLRDFPASASLEVGLKACATTLAIDFVCFYFMCISVC